MVLNEGFVDEDVRKASALTLSPFSPSLKSTDDFPLPCSYARLAAYWSGYRLKLQLVDHNVRKTNDELCLNFFRLSKTLMTITFPIALLCFAAVSSRFNCHRRRVF